MAWQKGRKRGAKTGGRVKGQNTSQDIRVLIRASLEQVGGLEYLVKQAQENPKAYLSLIARIIPTEIKAELATPQAVQIEVVTGFSSGPFER